MPTSKNPGSLRWQWTVLCHNGETFRIALQGDRGSASLGESYMVSKRAAKFVALGVILAGTLVAESKKEYHFAVGPKAGVSVMNPYGSASVKPSPKNSVVVNSILHSDKVEYGKRQNGNRVDIQFHMLLGDHA